MRPICCCIATITHGKNMQADQSWSISYMTLIYGSVWREAIESDTSRSWTLTWVDWSCDGSQVGLVRCTATEGDCMFIPWPKGMNMDCKTAFKWLPGNVHFVILGALMVQVFCSKTLPQRPEECYGVIGELTCFQTSKWDPKRGGFEKLHSAEYYG